MKKILLYLVKFINNFTNQKLTPDEEAESVLNYLLWKTSITHTIEVNEALQRKLKAKLFATKEDYLQVVSKIDETYRESNKIIYHLEK